MNLLRFGLLIAAFATSPANAQAFGVKPGAPVSQYLGKPTGHDNQYTITVPEPNSEFDSYVAYATPQTGICAVSGLGKTYENDGYGSEVRSGYEKLQLALKEKYGQDKEFDFLNSGALWTKPSEFSWSIYQNERNLASFWDTESGSSNLGEIKGIMLDVRAVSPTATYVNLRYEFKNYVLCKAILDKQNNAGL